MKGVYIAGEGSWCYSNERRFNSHAPTRVAVWLSHRADGDTRRGGECVCVGGGGGERRGKAGETWTALRPADRRRRSCQVLLRLMIRVWVGLGGC
jgi:hypothetical protein